MAELAGTVGPEVAVQDRVAVGDLAVVNAVDDRRHDELVVFATGIALLDSGNGRRSAEVRHAVDDGVEALAGPLPSLVAVHGVVAAADRGNPGVRVGRRKARLEVRHVLDGGSRRGVAAVEEPVDADTPNAQARG